MLAARLHKLDIFLSGSGGLALAVGAENAVFGCEETGARFDVIEGCGGGEDAGCSDLVCSEP